MRLVALCLLCLLVISCTAQKPAQVDTSVKASECSGKLSQSQAEVMQAREELSTCQKQLEDAGNVFGS